MKTRYLPPGSMRKQRRKGRIEGAAGMLTLLACAGAALIALTPPEMVRATYAGQEKAAPPLHFDRVPLPPCTDMESKDCIRTDDPKRLVVNTVPEPGTLALIPAALVAAHFTRRKP